MSEDRASNSPSVLEAEKIVPRQAAPHRWADRFTLGALVGISLALLLSGAANIALYKDDQCRRLNREARWGAQYLSCLSDVTRWEVSALARGPAAAADEQAGSFSTWLTVPLAYALVGGLVGQLSMRRALIGAFILQALLVGVLALMGFFAIYVG